MTLSGVMAPLQGASDGPHHGSGFRQESGKHAVYQARSSHFHHFHSVTICDKSVPEQVWDSQSAVSYVSSLTLFLEPASQIETTQISKFSLDHSLHLSTNSSTHPNFWVFSIEFPL